jgi:phosphoribosylamine--glycine ligase
VGLMITPDGPRVVEFNCRFGDPECQAIVPCLDEDLLPLLLAVATGSALPSVVTRRPESSVCVVLASDGYPGRYETGRVISGVEAAARVAGATIFHAGTARRDGALVTAGGRVLGVQALGNTIVEAVGRAYEAVDRISFEGMHFRKDIGRRAIGRR